MYACPYCSYQVQDFALQCPRCEGDVWTMALLHELPDALFNQALAAARRGDWINATQRAGALLSLRSADPEAWMLLGLVYARRGTWDLARECLQMVLLFQPQHARARTALENLRVAMGGQSGDTR